MTRWVDTNTGSIAAAMLFTALLIVVHPAGGASPASQPVADGQAPRSDSEKGWLAGGRELADAAATKSTAPTDEPAAAEAAPAASEKTAEELAKAAQNPVANMISVPLQSNFNFYDIHTHLAGQDYDRHTMGYLLNVQPVIPFKLSEDWNLITRTIIPIINQPELVPGMGSHGGLGDIQFTPFLSPAKPGKVIWGVGPVLQFPTATDQWLGSGKWNAGPSGLVLTMQGPWVMGVLAQNVWSYAGDSDRNYVNQMLINPFVNYNLPGGWYLTMSPNITADWHADSEERWTVPIGGGVGRLFRVGKQPVNIQLAGYYNVVHPTLGPEWTVRLQIQFLFPK